MNALLALKTLHILSGAVLFGTGLGIAFFMFMAHRSRDPHLVARVGRMVVLADFVFTATAVILQPITGAALARAEGVRLGAGWLVATYGLYVVIGLCWLPVVWLQKRMTDLAAAAAAGGLPLPDLYRKHFLLWFWLGWPAFIGVLAIYGLMVAKPDVHLALSPLPG